MNLDCQKTKLIAHKQYFAGSLVSRFHLPTLAMLSSAAVIGWRAGRKHWGKNMMRQAVEVGVLATLNSFKSTIGSYFSAVSTSSINRIISKSLKK